jgi:UDP-N-acetylglucosamine pyrophosphorylase
MGSGAVVGDMIMSVMTRHHGKRNVFELACRRGDTVEVVEYSEIPEADAASTDDNGRLKHNWANICMHFFSVEWLSVAVEHLESNLKCVRAASACMFSFASFE